MKLRRRFVEWTRIPPVRILETTFISTTSTILGARLQWHSKYNLRRRWRPLTLAVRPAVAVTDHGHRNQRQHHTIAAKPP